MTDSPSSNERVSDARLEHLIRIAEMDCRKTSILLKDGGYSEGNIPAAQLRALTELRERRAVETSDECERLRAENKENFARAVSLLYLLPTEVQVKQAREVLEEYKRWRDSMEMHPCDDGLRTRVCPGCEGKGCGYCNEGVQLIRAEEPTPALIKRHPRDCDCTSCHYSKKFPQVKPHHATCGCFECTLVKAGEDHAIV